LNLVMTERTRVQEIDVPLVALFEELDFFLAIAICHDLNTQVTVCIIMFKLSYLCWCFGV